MGSVGVLPLQTAINGGQPPLKFLPHTVYFTKRAAENSATFLAIFMLLSLTHLHTFGVLRNARNAQINQLHTGKCLIHTV